MEKQSPMTHVDDIRTPLLLLSNTGDVRVPVTRSYELINVPREKGRDVSINCGSSRDTFRPILYVLAMSSVCEPFF